ncbi:DUF443 family protein [Staphylococcus aureus]
MMKYLNDNRYRSTWISLFFPFINWFITKYMSKLVEEFEI